MYNPQSSSFVWSANNHPLPPFAPWDVGHPTLNPSPLHRVSISHYSRHLAYWRTAAFTELYPYICEVNITKCNNVVLLLPLLLLSTQFAFRYNEQRSQSIVTIQMI